MRAMMAVVVVCLLSDLALAQKTKSGKFSFDAEAKVKAYLKDNVNDPAKLSFVKITKPFDRKGWRSFRGGKNDRQIGNYWIAFPDGGPTVYAKYRTANGFGALILKEEVFAFDKNGELLRTYDPQDIIPPVGSEVSDPYTDSFLEQFR
jgi:hypothetical protein